MAATCQMVQFDGRQLRSPIKNYNSFFPHFVSPLAADNAIRSAPSSVCQEGGPFSSHPPRLDAFDVYARKGFRETVFSSPSFIPSLAPAFLSTWLTLLQGGEAFFFNAAGGKRTDENCQSQMGA